jgi:hypothetical protein
MIRSYGIAPPVRLAGLTWIGVLRETYSITRFVSI